MNPKKFVEAIRTSVVQENELVYRDLFSSTTISESTDEYWKDALTFFNRLDEGDRGIFFNILRQVSVDTVSNILGVIDGTSSLDGIDEEFELSVVDTSEVISGDLQDLFLESEELNS